MLAVQLQDVVAASVKQAFDVIGLSLAIIYVAKYALGSNDVRTPATP